MREMKFRTKFLVGLAAAAVIIQTGVALGLRVEDMQLYVFPLVLLSFFLVGKDSFRPPLFALALVFILWGFSGLKVRGFIPNFSEGVYLAKLSGDVDGAKAELFRQRYRRISRNYKLPTLNLLQREIPSKKEALDWLDKNSKGLLLLHGDSKWFSASLPNDFSSFLSDEDLGKNSFQDFSDLELETVELLRLESIKDKFIPVYEKDFESTFLIAKGPRVFKLPYSDNELTQFYTAWLASAFEIDSEEVDPGLIKQRAYRGLSEASELEGAWKSSLPRGFSRFLLGSAEVLLGSVTGNSDNLSCGIANLKKSASFVHARESKETLAAVLNNAAVARIMFSKDYIEMRETKSWLWRAANFRDKQGEPVPSAIIAYFNLIQLERTFSVPI